MYRFIGSIDESRFSSLINAQNLCVYQTVLNWNRSLGDGGQLVPCLCFFFAFYSIEHVVAWLKWFCMFLKELVKVSLALILGTFQLLLCFRDNFSE